MSPNATEHGAESMDDSSTSFEEDSNGVSSKPEEDDKQPRVTKKKGSKTSSTTNSNDSTSTSATATVARHPTSQSGLPTFAAAAAAAAPRSEKRPRKAGFRDQFLPKLRVMLDYETQNNNTIVHWSTDGNSFIVTDKTKFEADIYPKYFQSRIIFATFLSKLYRWGFSRLTSKSGRYEFRSPTFLRLANDSSPATAAAAAADTSRNAEGGASIPVQQQHQTQAASTLQQVMMAQTNQPPAPNPLPSQVDGIAALISNIQHSSQQPSISSQQSVLNRLLNMNLFHQQPFQKWQHPNPTTNLLNTALLSILAGNQTPSAPPLIDYSPVSSSHQGDAMQALMSLYGMSSRAGGTFPNTNTTPAISQPDNAVQSRLTLIHRVCEDNRQRRAQAASVQNAINASIGQILGVSNTIDEAERQRGLLAAALGQTLGSTGDATTPNVPLAATHLTGMTTLPVPYIAAAGQMQQGIPPPSAAGSLNFQADPIAAILQAARRPDDDDGNDEGKDDRPLSQRKRKSPDDGYSDGRRRKK